MELRGKGTLGKTCEPRSRPGARPGGEPDWAAPVGGAAGRLHSVPEGILKG